MVRLTTPSQEIVDRLATEPLVAERDVRAFGTALVGLTVDEAITMMDELSFRRSWNLSTRMAIAELIVEAKLSTN